MKVKKIKIETIEQYYEFLMFAKNRKIEYEKYVSDDGEDFIIMKVLYGNMEIFFEIKEKKRTLFMRQTFSKEINDLIRS